MQKKKEKNEKKPLSIHSTINRRAAQGGSL